MESYMDKVIVMHEVQIGNLKIVVGDCDVIIDDLDTRTRIFNDTVVGENAIRKQRTSEDYLAKLATGLIFRLKKSDRDDLVDKIIEGLFKYEYFLAGYKAKFYLYYYDRLIECGYEPRDPYADTVAEYEHTRQVKAKRDELKYQGWKFAQTHY